MKKGNEDGKKDKKEREEEERLERQYLPLEKGIIVRWSVSLSLSLSRAVWAGEVKWNALYESRVRCRKEIRYGGMFQKPVSRGKGKILDEFIIYHRHKRTLRAGASNHRVPSLDEHRHKDILNAPHRYAKRLCLPKDNAPEAAFELFFHGIFRHATAATRIFKDNNEKAARRTVHPLGRFSHVASFPLFRRILCFSLHPVILDILCTYDTFFFLITRWNTLKRLKFFVKNYLGSWNCSSRSLSSWSGIVPLKTPRREWSRILKSSIENVEWNSSSKSFSLFQVNRCILITHMTLFFATFLLKFLAERRRCVLKVIASSHFKLFSYFHYFWWTTCHILIHWEYLAPFWNIPFPKKV